MNAYGADITDRRPPIANTVAEFIAFTQRTPLSAALIAGIAAGAPLGDGTAVLVLPSIFRDDAQTGNLRRLLTQLGYRPFGWELGRNLGPTPGLLVGAAARLEALAAHHGKVAIIGFSMGGLFARWLAIRAPERVQQIITVGSPIRQPLHSAFMPAQVIEATWRGQNLQALSDEIGQDISVPATCVYSRRDGIVDWQSCYDPHSDQNSFEVSCRHVMMPQNPDVFRIIAERLAANRPKSPIGQVN